MANRNSKEALQFVVALSKAVTNSLSDGKIDLWDAVKFLSAVQTVGAALKDANLIPQELSSMSAAEKAELNFLIEQIDLPSDQVEQWVEQALKFAVQFGNLVAPLRK